MFSRPGVREAIGVSYRHPLSAGGRILSGGAVAVAATMAVADAGCAQSAERSASSQSPPMTRLDARPIARAAACRAGEYELQVAPGRHALLRVTAGGSGRRRPLLLALHGAGSGGAPGGMWAFRGAWDAPGLVIVAPAAAGSTWTLGPTDVVFVDRALQRAFRRCRVDPGRIAVGGFSAGAAMALWLGLTNGDLFRAVIALSGGGALPTERIGKPRAFVAHGTLDRVIPIEFGGDRFVRELRGDGYRVTYRRFRGGHRVRPAIAREAVLATLFR